MKLSYSKYGWKCVLGAEVAYLVCIFGAYLPLRSTKGMELHRALLEILPGFVWGERGSVLLGTGLIFVLAWIFAVYMVWMFNSSLVSKS
ncbi:MAG: hypothetical protein AAB606_04165 [Patescibacteria group bacterium]